MTFLRLLLILMTGSLVAGPVKLTFPTDNRALLDGKPEDFYMFVPRNFEMVASKPWTAGQYGFVRTLVRTKKEGVIPIKFHEGIDISPIRRDRNGRALDEVRSIGFGEVVYVNRKAGASNYGKYVVISHDWGDGPMFSLYAHLSHTRAEVGQKVTGGTPIGVMGDTGDGLNRERSHLHLELALLTSNHFEDWLGAKSAHGIYDGRNLIGLDVASLLLATKDGNEPSIPEFMKGASPYFRVAIPREDELEICKRYPWLKRGDHSISSPSWEMSFTDSGIPLSVAPSRRPVSRPTVTYVRTTRSKHEYYTRSRLTGTGRNASLTRSGRRFIELFSQKKKPVSPKTTDDES